MLRRWRRHRHLSQLDLAGLAAVSQRHLSHIETGKARPSPEMVQHLAEVMEVPLRDRNALLLAAGHAPRYTETPLDAPEMQDVRRAISLLLSSHEPYPAIVVDRHWNLIDANDGASRLTSRLIEPSSAAVTDPPNVMRLIFHPEGLRSVIANWHELAPAMATRVRRDAAARPEDRELQNLAREALSYPGVPDTGPAAAPGLIVPVHYRRGEFEVRLFSTLATLGSPLDVTLEELSIELFFPADAASVAALESL